MQFECVRYVISKNTLSIYLNKLYIELNRIMIKSLFYLRIVNVIFIDCNVKMNFHILFAYFPHILHI